MPHSLPVHVSRRSRRARGDARGAHGHVHAGAARAVRQAGGWQENLLRGGLFDVAGAQRADLSVRRQDETEERVRQPQGSQRLHRGADLSQGGHRGWVTTR